MKKLTLAISLAISFSALNAENIDGTLAVDNQLTNVHTTAQATLQENTNKLSTTAQANLEDTSNQLSAGLDDAQNSMKTTEPAASVPVGTGYSYTEGPFVGLELNGVTASDADGISASGASFGLRFGAQNIDWRTMAILERFSNNGEANAYTRGLLQLDYFFLGQDKLMIDTYGIRPYAGLNAGLLSLDTSSNENIKSLTYGAQLGATMNITNNIDFDLGYRYNLSSSERIDHTSGITAGIHYKY